MKNKIGKKSKGKMDSVSKKGQGNYSRKSFHGKVSIKQNDILHISSQEIDQQELNIVSEARDMVDISANPSTACQHSIFSVLFPQPHNQDASIQTPKETVVINNASIPSINSLCSGDLELLYEYFELEQPQQRQPLYEKIQELVRGNILIQSTTYGDLTKLDSINLQDLHPRSWYSVAWYPIYRIPDDNFRASFLTYHSFGHLVRRRTSSDLSNVGSCIVSPAVGLQSYNAQIIGAVPTNTFRNTRHRVSNISSSSSGAFVPSSSSNQWQEKYNNLESAFKAYMIMKEGGIPEELASFFTPESHPNDASSVPHTPLDARGSSAASNP